MFTRKEKDVTSPNNIQFTFQISCAVAFVMETEHYACCDAMFHGSLGSWWLGGKVLSSRTENCMFENTFNRRTCKQAKQNSAASYVNGTAEPETNITSYANGLAAELSLPVKKSRSRSSGPEEIPVPYPPSGLDDIWSDSEDADTLPQTDESCSDFSVDVGPQPFSQRELKDLVRNLGLSKDGTELLGSKL
ncbi:hypothetical protein AVEN_165044-1 [Araneus ventricosus]|uniref:Uncharacterized protein n=1 Tax=Araneus ventricosus TaxID=182803 RepID=A0A4Y2J957_ARAVE|nr:hypothetical protein AVEN_165044-1 [Araneus ventricosus]